MRICLNYYDLVESLRERRARLGISQMEVDLIAGFHHGYCGKLEQPLGLTLAIVRKHPISENRPVKDIAQLEFDF